MLIEVRKYLNANKGRLPVISAGVGLSYSMVTKVASGARKNPSQDTTERLYRFALSDGWQPICCPTCGGSLSARAGADGRDSASVD